MSSPIVHGTLEQTDSTPTLLCDLFIKQRTDPRLLVWQPSIGPHYLWDKAQTSQLSTPVPSQWSPIPLSSPLFRPPHRMTLASTHTKPTILPIHHAPLCLCNSCSLCLESAFSLLSGRSSFMASFPPSFLLAVPSSITNLDCDYFYTCAPCKPVPLGGQGPWRFPFSHLQCLAL